MPQFVVTASESPIRLPLRELWQYRELLYFLIWRDVKVRYKQTFFGAAWAVMQPLLLMVVFSIFLGRLAGVGSEGLPYPIFAYAALVPWTLFAQSLIGSTSSVVGSTNLISKVYFPRILLPLAAVGSYLIDFFIALALLVVMMFFYKVQLSLSVLWVLALLPLAVLTALAVGLWLSALNVRYRDVQYVVPFLVQLWLFASPVAYSSSIVPERYRALYGLNPMAGVVQGFRWALLGAGDPPGPLIAVSVAMTLVIFVAGLFYFQRVERTFADVI